MRMRLGAAVLAAALVACSGSSKKPSQPSTTTSPSTSAPASTGATTTAPAPAAVDAGWTQFAHDAARTGHVDGPPVHRQAWSSSTLDGPIYAQPLIVGESVFVATENNTLYALDATTGHTKWSTHVGQPVRGSSLPCGNIDPVGITGTPAIDVKTNRIFAVGFVSPGRHELFALDAATGALAFHFPVDPPGSDPKVLGDRGALSVNNGRVYMPFGGRFGDCGKYHGWVVSASVDGAGGATNFQVPSGNQGGIWTPPGLTIDASTGDVFAATGNSESRTTYDQGDSVIRLSGALAAKDSFAPSNWANLNRNDIDLGSLAPTVLPSGFVFQAGKEGIGYLLKANALGGIGGELFSSRVCRAAAFGATSYTTGDIIFVPCQSGVVAIRVHDNRFDAVWNGADFNAGPTAVVGAVVYVVDVSNTDLVGLDAASGKEVFRHDIGKSTHFTSAAAGHNLVVVPGGTQVLAFAP
jgi:outer membrane protein assembly factor BamB